jgi:hypothetical protein
LPSRVLRNRSSNDSFVLSKVVTALMGTPCDA